MSEGVLVGVSVGVLVGVSVGVVLTNFISHAVDTPCL